MAKKRDVVEAGSGNVFEDLGFADAGERRLKVQLAMRVNELIEDRGITQVKAAKLFVVPQPHVSEWRTTSSAGSPQSGLCISLLSSIVMWRS